jgi:hypothetical protein
VRSKREPQEPLRNEKQSLRDTEEIINPGRSKRLIGKKTQKKIPEKKILKILEFKNLVNWSIFAVAFLYNACAAHSPDTDLFSLSSLFLPPVPLQYRPWSIFPAHRHPVSVSAY